MSDRTTTARTRRRAWQLGGALALAAAVVVAIVLAAGGGDGGTPARKPGEQLPGQFEANERFAGIPQHGITLGDPNAPLTLVEYADLQCPFCRQYTTDVLPRIVAQYVLPGKLKMVFRPVAILAADSVPAARMAAAAGRQNRLWPFVEIFYVNQGAEGSGYVTDAFLSRIARAVKGLDVERALRDRELASVQRQLSETQTSFQRSGATGTPSFQLGRTGGPLTLLSADDHVSADAMAARIDQALRGTDQ